MFPVDISWTLPFYTSGNVYAAMIKGVIDSKEKQIVAECQKYLTRYETGYRSDYSTDLDYLITLVPKRK